jgi:cold shock CspA family protein
MGVTPPQLGTVEAFDERVGLGTVRSADGVELSFHCTAITDGTRTIQVGVPVAFVASATHHGAHEARAVTPLNEK